VIIPARDAGQGLSRCLDSVAAQDYPNLIEVIVATTDPADLGPGITVVPNPGGTTPHGLNLAWRHAAGEIIARCDTHSSLPVGYLTSAVTTLGDTGADVVGGMQVPVGDGPWSAAIAAAMRSRLGAGDARYRIGGEAGPTETVYLGVFKRSALERLGGFDETFHRTQDYELNHRVIESGGVVWFDPSLRVEYTPRSSLAELADQYFEYGRAKRRFSGRHPGALRWRQMAAPILVVVLAAALIWSFWWPPALALPGAYLVALVIGGIGSGESFWRVAAALATMHLSWGVGFLTGRR
jgi:hypothetical protein